MPLHLVREHLLTALLESPEDGILGVSLDGTIDTWSRGAERIYGYTAQEITGQPVSRLVPLHEWPGLKRFFSEAAGNGLKCSETVERLHKNGSRISLRINREVIRDEQGEVRGILESGRVIDSPERATPSEAHLRSLIKQMPGLHWTMDQSLRITSNWGKGLPTSRIHANALVGRSVCEFLGCADRHATPLAEHYGALRGESMQFECNWNSRVLEVHLEPLRTASGDMSTAVRRTWRCGTAAMSLQLFLSTPTREWRNRLRCASRTGCETIRASQRSASASA